MGLPIQTFSIAMELVTEECCNCHTVFAMTSDLKRKRQEDHEWFYCPNGHGQHYVGESEADKYKRLLQYEREAGERYKNQVKAAEDQARAFKGHLTRKKRQLARINNGVCPCCNRTFQNLMRHMQTKHPDFNDQ